MKHIPMVGSKANLEQLIHFKMSDFPLSFPEGRELPYKKEKSLKKFYTSSLNTIAARDHFLSLKFKPAPAIHGVDSPVDDEDEVVLVDLQKSDQVIRDQDSFRPAEFDHWKRQFVSDSSVLGAKSKTVQDRKRTKASKLKSSRSRHKKPRVRDNDLPDAHGKQEVLGPDISTDEEDYEDDSGSMDSEIDSDCSVEVRMNNISSE
jgi:hypothetical protein